MKLFTQFIFISFLCVLAAPKAHACKCKIINSGNINEYYERADYVFEGIVTAIKEEIISVNGNDLRLHRIFFKITKPWKGDRPHEIGVLSRSFKPSCGYEFVTKERYLIFANKDKKNNELITEKCGGTARQGTERFYVNRFLINELLRKQQER